MIRPLVKFPDKLLSRISVDVEKVDAGIKTLMLDMLDTMYAENGIGLSAVQVGYLRRIIVIDLQENGERSPIMMANPVVLETSDSIDNSTEEGCLSVPEYRTTNNRFSFIKVSYTDENGTSQIIEMTGLLAVCFQHELDHLNGITIADNLSRLKRERLATKIKKNN